MSVVRPRPIRTDPALLESFAVEDRVLRSVVVLEVESTYFQCARAIARAALWSPERQVAPDSLPSAGEILAALSEGRVGGDQYEGSGDSGRGRRSGKCDCSPRCW